MDNIDIGPERRLYLDHKMERLWENNGKVECVLEHGSVPACFLILSDMIECCRDPYHMFLS